VKPLDVVLATIPEVYAQLGEALTPGRGGGEPSAPDPLHKPAPARLDAVEHRHLLLRGLRWWLATTSSSGVPEGVGDSPAKACAILLARLPHLTAEQRAELHSNMDGWLRKAWPLVGDVATPKPARLPLQAMHQRVPVHVAAEVLGVSVSTVKRRTPDRVGGHVTLEDAAGPLCEQSDLPEPWCWHCRPDTVRAQFA